MRRRAVVVGLLVVLVLAVWVALRVPLPGAQAGGIRVERVVDGDTLRVRRDGDLVTVRLLNVDTPETVKPDTPVQCGGPQASEWLHRRLPIGEAVTLTYDVERTDRYGRDLARVTASDGGVVNDEIAALGLGRAIAIGANRTWYPQVKALEERARQDRLGLFDPALGCPTERSSAANRSG